MKPEIIYHYTSVTILKIIIESGELKVSEFEKNQKDKIPCLWFSSNQIWENTSNKMVKDVMTGEVIRLSKQEQFLKYGLGRIGIKYKPDLLTWGKYRHLSRFTTIYLDNMERVAFIEGANPNEWFASTKNIPAKEWVYVQKWDGEKWIDYNAE